MSILNASTVLHQDTMIYDFCGFQKFLQKFSTNCTRPNLAKFTVLLQRECFAAKKPKKQGKT